MSGVIRGHDGRYIPGTCGGPGRPKNSRPKLITALREALDEDDTLERLRRVAIGKLEEGDPAFWRMLLDRVWPVKLEIEGEVGNRVEFRWAAPEVMAEVVDVGGQAKE